MPTCERDAYVGGWPTTEVPMLMIEGTLCGATAVCAAHGLADHFDGPHQYHYEHPRSPCCSLGQSVADAPTGLTCGADLFFQFIDNPLVEPDASCVDEMYPLDFAGNPDHSMTIFGTSDLWENGTKAEAGVVAVEPPGLDRARRMLRLAGLGVR
ncbi:MAG: hypothetical protein JXB32_15235 [Deltaproteobacteria bacterium]|nr:hypothetical protein [Deltaproteobacteria bacterium]